MVIKPRLMRALVPPKLFIGGSEIRYVDNFKYLGHIISSDFTDDLDIEREVRSLYIRGNTIARKFHFLSHDVKVALFESYCYPLYTCALWSKYKQRSMNKLKVAYNNMMRKLFGVAPWHSARNMFVRLNVRSFFENVRKISYSLMSGVLKCQNSIVVTLVHSDCFIQSGTRRIWVENLFLNRLEAIYSIQV